MAGLLRNLLRRLIQPATPRRAATDPRVAMMSERDKQVLAEMAQQRANQISESLKIAETSRNPETILSRLDLAETRLEEVRGMAEQFPFLEFPDEDYWSAKSRIEELRIECKLRGYKQIAEGNLNGQSLEKEGRLDDAIDAYEALAARNVDTPHTYRRLAILYRKQRRRDDEARILRCAVQNIPANNPAHHAWFVQRLNKLAGNEGCAQEGAGDHR